MATVFRVAVRGLAGALAAGGRSWPPAWSAAGRAGAKRPYVACPASFEDLARGIVAVPLGAGRALGLVPGLVSRTADAAPDVMRGEEAQVFGALKLSGREDGVFVLPGTHSKWVSVADGRIMRFHSFMTGEIYGLLKHAFDPRPADAAEWRAALRPRGFRGRQRAGAGRSVRGAAASPVLGAHPGAVRALHAGRVAELSLGAADRRGGPRGDLAVWASALPCRSS